MGCWDEFCLVCGGPPGVPPVYCYMEDWEGSEQEKEALCASLTGLEWLGNYVGVLETEAVVPLGAYDSNGGFDPHPDSDSAVTVHIWTAFMGIYHGLEEDDINKEEEGYVRVNWMPALTCHEKCLQLLQRDLAYTLRFQDVWPMLMVEHEGRTQNSFHWSGYGGIAEYHDQDFLFQEIVSDGNAWMLHDPTTSVKNAQRILEVWRPLVQNGFTIPDSNHSNSGQK